MRFLVYDIWSILYSKIIEKCINFEYKNDHISKNKNRNNRKIYFPFVSEHCATTWTKKSGCMHIVYPELGIIRNGRTYYAAVRYDWKNNKNKFKIFFAGFFLGKIFLIFQPETAEMNGTFTWNIPYLLWYPDKIPPE